MIGNTVHPWPEVLTLLSLGECLQFFGNSSSEIKYWEVHSVVGLDKLISLYGYVFKVNPTFCNVPYVIAMPCAFHILSNPFCYLPVAISYDDAIFPSASSSSEGQ